MGKEYVIDIFSDEFPKVQVMECSSNYIDTAERYQYQYPIIMKYLRKKIKGWNVGDFLYKLGVQKIALYAITEFTELIIDDIEKSTRPIEVSVICDKNNKKYGKEYYRYEVLGIDDLVEWYRLKKVDKILVCNIFHMNEIFEELKEKEIKQVDMISVTDAIFNG